MRALVDVVGQDVRYALRALRRSPVFALVATASLALGIGATTAVFTLANVMLLAPLPYPAAERLLVPYQTVVRAPGAAADTVPWSVAHYREMRRYVPTFESVGFAAWTDLNLRAPGTAALWTVERVRAEVVTASLFTTFGVGPAMGRPFLPDEDAPGVPHTVGVISHRLWRRLFAGGPVLGATVELDGAPVTIVGIMPPRFTGFAGSADVWVPLHVMPRIQPGTRWTDRFDDQVGTVIARLRPDIPPRLIEGQVAAAAREIGALRPGPGPRPVARGGGVVRLDEARRHPMVRPLLLLLATAVGAVVLIVCANIAGLLLARGQARQMEFGLRLALGAARGRVARQVLTECLVLATFGAVPGLLVAYWGAAALAHLRPRLPQTWTLLRGTDLLDGASLAPDVRVMVFATGLTLLVGLLFGAAPAHAAAGARVGDLLTAGATRAAGRPGRISTRWVLVIGQVALATTLLVGAGLMVRSLWFMLRDDLGFEPQGVVVMGLASADTTAAAAVRRVELMERVAAIPGIEAVALHDCVPFDVQCLFTVPLVADGRAPDEGRPPEAEVRVVTAGFLRLMHIPIVAGRGFGQEEELGRSRGVILSASAATRLWGSPRDAIGRRVLAHGSGRPPSEVIGVAGDAKLAAIDRPAGAVVYLAANPTAAPGGRFTTNLYIRARTTPAATVAALRAEVRLADPSLAMFNVTTLRDLVRVAASSTRFVTALLVGFALVAVFLAALGVYGVLAYLVTMRTREFGIRLAIGATPAWVLRHIVRQGAALTGVGLAVGVLAALGATGVLSRFLYGVARADAVTYGVIAALVGAVGLVAAILPARRATRVDPAVALRAE